ncbi:hypothetical protein STANM309S_05273 [Streptomyces tanashiensis]
MTRPFAVWLRIAPVAPFARSTVTVLFPSPRSVRVTRSPVTRVTVLLVADALKVSGTVGAVFAAAGVCPAESITRETPAASSAALPLSKGVVLDVIVRTPRGPGVGGVPGAARSLGPWGGC